MESRPWNPSNHLSNKGLGGDEAFLNGNEHGPCFVSVLLGNRRTVEGAGLPMALEVQAHIDLVISSWVSRITRTMDFDSSHRGSARYVVRESIRLP